jgi:hypothetical protein
MEVTKQQGAADGIKETDKESTSESVAVGQSARRTGVHYGAAAVPAMEISLQWSYWCRCYPSLFRRNPQKPDEGIPEIPGICIFGLMDSSNKNPAIVHAEITYNLAQTLDRLLSTGSPIDRYLQQGQCFVRWAPIARRQVRDHLLSVIRSWVAAGSPATSKPVVVQELLVPEVLDPMRN